MPVLPKNANLTPTEVRIIQLMADGLSNKMISRRMNYAEGTLEAYKWEMYKRLKVYNSCHCVAYALRNGLIK